MKYAVLTNGKDNNRIVCIFYNANQRRYIKERLHGFEQMGNIPAKEAYKMLNAGKFPLDFTVGYNKEDF